MAASMTANSRGRVNIPPTVGFQGLHTIGEAPIVDPGPIQEVDSPPRCNEDAFSHSLGHPQPLVQRPQFVEAVRCQTSRGTFTECSY